MTRSSVAATAHASAHRPNLLALLIAGAAVGFLYVNCDPTPAGIEAGDGSASSAYPPPPPMAQPIGVTGAGSSAEASQSSDVIIGRWAMLMNAMLLRQGQAAFEQVPDYSATLYKQERINGDLTDMQTMHLKLRHQPFSVYMRWLTGDKGRELIYVEGKNDGNMLVQPGGWRGRLTGTLSLDPSGTLAISESRHPITSVGLLELAKTLLYYHERNLKEPGNYRCEMHDNQRLNGRDCYLFVVTYLSREKSPIYRKSIQYIDKELSLPICVKNFTWATDADPETIDDETLLEFYSYSDLQLDERLADGSFDAANSGYRFRR